MRVIDPKMPDLAFMPFLYPRLYSLPSVPLLAEERRLCAHCKSPGNHKNHAEAHLHFILPSYLALLLFQINARVDFWARVAFSSLRPRPGAGEWVDGYGKGELPKSADLGLLC